MVITEKEAYERYDETFDDMGDIVIGNLTFQPSRVVKELDEIAYNCGFNDFIDSLSQDNIYVEGWNEEEEEKKG